MQGNWTRAWPSEQISFLNCSFKGDETVSRGFFVVSTEVQAGSCEDARAIGKERIEEACYLFEFCLGGSVLLRREQIVSRPKDNHVAQGAVTVGGSATLYSPNPPAPEDLRRASDIASKVQQNPWLKRVIRWWGEGKREPNSIDRFIKFWIAFEWLGRKMHESRALGNQRGAWLQRIRKVVATRFPRPGPGWFSLVRKVLAQSDEKRKLPRKFYKNRSKIFHTAYWPSREDADQCAQDMQQFLERLLQGYLRS